VPYGRQGFQSHVLFGFRRFTRSFTEAVEIIFYELPKLEEQVREYFENKAGMETLSEDEKWCIYLKYRHDENAEPLIEELCQKEEGIMRAEKAVEKISRSYLKYIREMNIKKNEYERNYMAYTARNEGLAEGHVVGLAEGRTEGRYDEKVEIARKMKTARKPMSEIAEFTGLSSQAIENL